MNFIQKGKEFCPACLELWEQGAKTALVSFTSTWLAFAKEELVIPPDAQFIFGCSRHHVLGNGIPMEATWANPKGQPSKHGEDITKEDLDPVIFLKWCVFRELVSTADKEGRVKWGK